VHLQTDLSLKPFNTLSIDATATGLAQVADYSELLQALEWAQQRGLPVLPLGEGSNLVVAGDIDGLLLKQGSDKVELLDASDDTVLLKVDAGKDWHQLVQWTLAQGYFGLENLALIPGAVGAAPIQNIGAYGVEVESFISRVHGVDLATGKTLALAHADCQFGYRDSVFKGALRDKVIITSVEMQLSRHSHPRCHYPALNAWLEDHGITDASAQQVFEAVVAIRSSKLPDPAVEPNAGSFFKNPVIPSAQVQALLAQHPEMPVYPLSHTQAKVPAAWLIDRCGWKGQRDGDVGVHPQHALVLVNYGNCSGSELLAFARRITNSVSEGFGVALEIEPRIYG
jgi:UDP-N-acetylmuramate dehydrogenase